MSKYSIEIKFPNCTLIYDLFENSFIEKWVQIFHHEFSVQKVGINNGGDFYGSALFSPSDLLAQMQRCVDVVNAYIPGSIENKVYKGITHSDLMLLHKDFERLEPDSRYRTPIASPKVITALTELNIFIHQYECINSPPLSHIDISPRPVNRFEFEDEDYNLFVKEIHKGLLYLPYGVTGIPPMTAYMSKMTDLPVPQSNVTCGLSLYFVDIARNVDVNHMRKWFMDHWKMDIDDPKNSLGYIPLGKLRDIENMEKYIPQIVSNRKIESLKVTPTPDVSHFEASVKRLEIQPDEKKNSVLGDFSNTTWPGGKELYQHLELNPYLSLPVAFNHKECFKEAVRLLDSFVEHRQYDQTSTTQGKWKSLAIHGLAGDSKRTQNHVDYGIKEPEYKLTEIAKHCPETLKFINSITDISKCERIRFMLLEPGAKIKVHSDAPDKEVSIALNIALNMPEGCDFWVDLNKDGSKNLFSQKIPIQDGHVFIFNNATYHALENNSLENRIHIIVHGPLRIKNSTYLPVARNQNKISTEKILFNKLMFKRSFLGKPISESTIAEWLSIGVDRTFFHDEVSLAFLDDEVLPQDTRTEALELITKASFFPLKLDTVRFSDVDLWLQTQHSSRKKYALLIGCGIYSLSHKSFFLAAAKALGDLEKSDSPLMGQIIDRPVNFEDGKNLPYIHEQLMLINLEKWKPLSDTSFSVPYNSKTISFPNYAPSLENFHDDYTPTYIAPGDKIKSRVGRAGWGTEFMARMIESGQTVMNVPIELRNAKKFSYPRAAKSYQYEEVKTLISNFLNGCKNRVFIFNNEGLKPVGLSQFNPDVLISVSSGFKPFVLLKFLWQDRIPKKIIFVDYSQRCLDHLKRVVFCTDLSDLKRILIAEYCFQYSNIDKKESEKTINENLNKILAEEFDNSFENLKRYLDLCKSAIFLQMNFIDHPEELSKHFDPNLKTLFWHSNAWDCNPIYFTRTEASSILNYQALVKNTAAKLNSKFWIAEDNLSAIVGSSKNSPQVYFTDGMPTNVPPDTVNVKSVDSLQPDFKFNRFFKSVYFGNENRVSLNFRISDYAVQTFYSDISSIEKMFIEYESKGFFNIRPILVQKKDSYIRFTFYSNQGFEYNYRFSFEQWSEWTLEHRRFKGQAPKH